jgi:hypothetical protein
MRDRPMDHDEGIEPPTHYASEPEGDGPQDDVKDAEE